MQLTAQNLRNSSLLMMVFGLGLLFLSAQVYLSLDPVPITLQTVAVLIIGLSFKKADALRSIASYLALGALGAPMFSNFSGGHTIIAGPSGGYLVGFLVSIWVMCALRERMSKITTKELLLIGFIGSAIVYMIGVPWLSSFVGWKGAVSLGFLPFIIPGVIKSALVAGSIGYLQK